MFAFWYEWIFQTIVKIKFNSMP